ncbi:MAG: MerR family transcriptional regulator [Elusimicrobiota bacterium]
MYNLSMKRYNMVHAAKLLDVTRQTLYNWIRRGWVKPGRDYKDYPVFTESDMRKIKKWKDTIR